jgi:hypothetical protein
VRGGDPFAVVNRPDPISGLCPLGTTPCSLKTNKDNTVCYPKEDLTKLCPINDMKFVTKNEKDEYIKAGYEYSALSGSS